MNRYPIALNGACPSANRPAQALPGSASEQGVALVITLLVLALVTVLSLGMVIAFSSQTLIGAYYRNYRGAFYAADSGLNIARDQVVAELQADVPSTFTFPPVASSCGSSGAVSVGTSYGNPTTLNTGTASQSWKENFQITNATVSPATITQGVNTYSCVYRYSITSVGTATRQLTANGHRNRQHHSGREWRGGYQHRQLRVFRWFCGHLPRWHWAAGSRHDDRTDVHEQRVGIHGQPGSLDSALCFHGPCWAGMVPSGLLGHGMGPALDHGKQLGIRRQSHRPEISSRAFT